MNGKYYGQREIRWHSREKDRLEHINKRKEKDESIRRNCPDLGHSVGGSFGGISAELLDGASHRYSDRRISCPWNNHGICGNGYGMDTEFWR